MHNAPVIFVEIISGGLYISARPPRTMPQLATGPQKCVVFGPTSEFQKARRAWRVRWVRVAEGRVDGRCVGRRERAEAACTHFRHGRNSDGYLRVRETFFKDGFNVLLVLLVLLLEYLPRIVARWESPVCVTAAAASW